MSTDKTTKYGQLSQVDQTSLVAPSPADVEKATDATRMVELVAPATLIEGYILDVKIGDEIVPISIPPGGVEKGQKFSIPMPETKRSTGESAGPVGAWKDGLCDCFNYGLCHASCCISWCCKLIALGQIITRLKLNWCGVPTENKGQQKSAFSILVTLTILNFVIRMPLKVTIDQMNSQEQMNDQYSYSSYGASQHQPSTLLPILQIVYSLLTLAFVVLLLVVGLNVRSAVRSKYGIPETSCRGGMEDCCCIFWCSTCAIAQMLRHTGDYENRPSSCCSENGHFEV